MFQRLNKSTLMYKPLLFAKINRKMEYFFIIFLNTLV